MRKHLRKKISEIFTTLEEAHGEIGKIIKLKEIDFAIGIMAQCQDAAAAIGNAIEVSEGEGTQTVKYLESYCDILYRLSNLRLITILHIWVKAELNKAINSFKRKFRKN